MTDQRRDNWLSWLAIAAAMVTIVLAMRSIRIVLGWFGIAY